ncbi:MAG TPA: peptidylprolyl isomerase [Rhodocyclaceae bacterium]|nr:peptidylprolyl isomerase [Rhodocyclaceae bacterium]
MNAQNFPAMTFSHASFVRRIVGIAASAMLLGTCASAFAQKRVPIDADRVVAVVNDEAITLSELQARQATVERQLQGQSGSLPSKDILARQILERLIVDRAQLQLARDSGISVADAELDAALRRIAETNRMPLTEFRERLEKDGMRWSKFREEVRQEITISRLRDREVDSRVVVTDGEVDNYLSNVAANGDADAQVNISHVLIRTPEQATPEQLTKLSNKADQALAQLRAGEPFAKVAAAFSDSPDGLNGGVIGLRPLDRLPGLYAEAAKKLQPGEVSSVLRSPAGFHIVKLLERKGGVDSLPALRQTHARHILIKVNEVVSESEALHKIEGLRERLVNGGDFAELAKLHSQDLSSTKGGDLGWLNQGDTVPEFEKAMDALKIGELSQPVKSPFGYHLIQVQERRTDEGSPERKRLAARQALRERKAEEAYDDWVRQLRDRTYVEYKLDEQ